MLGALRFIFFGRRLAFCSFDRRVAFCSFGRCLALQLPPPAAGADGGGRRGWRLGAAPGGCRQGSGGCRQAPGAVATKSVQSGTYPHNA